MRFLQAYALTAALVFDPRAVGLVRSEQAIATPTADVRNVRVEAEPEGGVSITYDLVASDSRIVVATRLEASSSRDGTFDIVPRATRGDIGPGLTPGNGKRIVWDAARDIEDVQPERLRFRIVVSARSRGPGATDSRTDDGRAIVTVVTLPEGAMITLDGRPMGLSPLEITGVAAREHRITATKAGFAEQTKVIKIAAGSTDRVEMLLTSQTASAAQSGGGRGKWYAIGGGVAAAGLAAVALASGGQPPASTPSTPTTTTTPPATTTTTTPINRAPTVQCGNVIVGGLKTMTAGDVAVVSATRLQFFVSAAADADGDLLSFTIAYGNGVSSTGAYSSGNNSVTYVYPGAGVYSPSVTVRDARGGEAGCRFASVTTSTVAGEWIGPPTAGRISSRFVLSQSGVTVTGNYFEGERTTASTLQGTLSSNVAGRKDGAMSVIVGGNYSNQLSFLLEPSDDLRTYRGTFTYRGATSAFEMRKQ